MTTIDMDPNTGLPALPEGMRWRVSDTLRIILEQEKRNGRWKRIADRAIPTNSFGRNNFLPMTPSTTSIRDTAGEVFRDWQRSERISAAMRKDIEDRKRIVGTYPPKSL